MANDVEMLSREKKLAQEYAHKLSERQDKLIAKFQTQYQMRGSYIWHVSSYVSEDLSKKTYSRPSEYFETHLDWIFGPLVYDRFRGAFIHAVDQIREFPYSVSWERRSFRSEDYRSYTSQISAVLSTFFENGIIDADICDILTGNLPEEILCYLRNENPRPAGFPAAALAYELDQDNPRLEAIVTDIINGESPFAKVSSALIRGIVMSHNARMHGQLCKLLLAARLQEGLRQAICEAADSGTKEAFSAILSTIRENDLIRFSSVKRAVGTWLGLISEESRDLERVSSKSVELVCRCLSDRRFREECLHSEDVMQIHIALWSYGFESVQSATKALEELCRTGTHHQLLAAGYFARSLENPACLHTAATTVLRTHRDSGDLLAVYLPGFLPNANYLASRICLGHPGSAVIDDHFASRDEALDFCDWLVSEHRSMKKKELVFDPCIFPWNKEVLKKSDLIEKAMLIAAAAEDQPRIDALCPLIPDCDAFYREGFLKLLTRGQKTSAARTAIIKGLSDKAAETRRVAYNCCKELTLAAEEYLAIEDTLRLKYNDLRLNAMELLLRQSDDEIESTLERLLSAGKTEKRMAALDMLTRLNADNGRKAVAQRCMPLIKIISSPTTQEQILIDALMPRQESPAEEILFTVKDRYVPVVETDDFIRECLREFTRFFPDSKLEAQVLEGKFVYKDAGQASCAPCPSAERAKELIRDLSEYFTSHEAEPFKQHPSEEITQPIGTAIRDFHVYSPDTKVPRMDLWENWMQDRRISVYDLLRMYVLAWAEPSRDIPYVSLCCKYISDIYGSGFDAPVHYPYLEHMRKIIDALIDKSLSKEARLEFATALGAWISLCLPDNMLLGTRDGANAVGYQSDVLEILSNSLGGALSDSVAPKESLGHPPIAHFFAHPQIVVFLPWIELRREARFRQVIPVTLSLYERSFEAYRRFMQDWQLKREWHNQIVNQIFTRPAYHYDRHCFPSATSYLYACHLGLIGERSLLLHLTEPHILHQALTLTTSISSAKLENERRVSAHCFPQNRCGEMYRNFLEVIGDSPELSDEQLRLVALCRYVEGKLRPMVLEAELQRGDTPAKYSRYIPNIMTLSGVDTFVRILSALGKSPLDRSVYYWGHGGGKIENLSMLLNRCSPAEGDTVEMLGKRLSGTDIPERRLIEAALYNPEWIDLIGEYLGLPGFKSACYYFIAHMNERFDEHKKAVIARFTPLGEDDLNQGAFDIQWFRSAFEQLGESKFNMIYDAARYISDGNKHTRARKYADAALGRLSVKETEAAIREKRNKDLLMAYALIPLAGEDDLIHRYLYIQTFLKESRQFGAQRSASEKKAVETALRNLATNAGYADTMRLTLRMETKLSEDNCDLFEERQIEDWAFRLTVDNQGAADILCTKDGKALKAIPSKFRKNEYVLRLMDMKKQLTEQYRRTRRMFEEAMEDETEFTLGEMRSLSKNRVVSPILSALVFKSGEFLGLFDGNALIDLQGDTLAEADGAPMTVAHPLHLYRSGQWIDFQRHVFEHRIAQPFKQVFRELYVKTDDERGRLRSLRYAGHQIQPKKAAACLKARRWVVDPEAGLQKVYYRENIVATIYALADWFTPADIEAPTLEYVAFYHRTTGKALNIDAIPDVIFSEVMRDVDMAVSVAHAGGVDPETSHSTVEMRAAILGFTLPLLHLKNVQIRGNHALIEGTLAKYSIHLGSGVAHQIGGAMLNVTPVHSQHRGRIFLPFVDDDPKTAEIVSKVILFSEDKKLKDPTILSQISF